MEKTKTIRSLVKGVALLVLCTLFPCLWVSYHPAPPHLQAFLHTVFEVVAFLLALFAGSVSLVRYYSRKNNTFLFLGVGFVGAALLDGYHAVVSAPFVSETLTWFSDSLVSWTWLVARLYLAVMLYLSWWAWRAEVVKGAAGRVREAYVYVGAGILVLVSFCLPLLVPSPNVYVAQVIPGRPAELVPALFLLLAVVGYARKGQWKIDPFEYWLMLSLVAGLIAQVPFMAISAHLFDAPFEAAHLAKITSYTYVAVGLLISTYHLFQQAEESSEEIGEANRALQWEIAVREQAERVLRESEARNRALLDALPDMMIRIRRDGTCLDIRAREDGLISVEPGALRGRFLLEVVPPDFAQRVMEKVEAALATRKMQVFEYRAPIGGELRDLEARLVVCGEDEVVSIVRDVTDRKRMERLKNDFISVVSHELRTPLTSINGSLALMATGVAGELPEQVQAMVEIAHRNSDRLVRLINDLLDIQKIESGSMPLNVQPVELMPLVEHALEANEAYAARYEVSFELAGDDDVWVNADPDRLMQVVTNLLSNAVKFSPERSVVRVRLQRDTETVRVSVQDRGPGIPEEYRTRIFDKFVQVDASNTRQREGTGLGLSICKSIVERHGGIIDFETTVGEGTTFFFTLPLLKDSSHAPLPSPESSCSDALSFEEETTAIQT